MKTRSEIHEIAANEGLQVIETTSEANGYPANCQLAIIGFDTIEQANDVAERYGLRVMEFERRGGWQLWYRTGNRMYEAYDTREIFAEDGDIYESEDGDGFYDNEVRPYLDQFSNFDELQAFIDQQKEVLDDIQMLDGDELLITHHGSDLRETWPKRSMRFDYDTKQSVIGVIE